MSTSVPFAEVDEDIRELLEARGGQVSNLYRVLANNPAFLTAWIDFAWSLRLQAGVSRVLRELMILRSAQMHGAGFQMHEHSLMATRAGIGEDQIAALEDWRSSDLFDEPTRCALAFTEEMVAGRVEDETLAELAGHFKPDERIELMMTAGFYCMVPRVLNALRLEAPEED